MIAEGTGAGVGLEACGFEVVGGGAVDAAVELRQVEQAGFEVADAGFDGAVVAGGARGGMQCNDAVGIEKLADVVGGKVRAVVGLDHQGRAAGSKEHLQGAAGDLGGVVIGGQCRELTAAGQISHRG